MDRQCGWHSIRIACCLVHLLHGMLSHQSGLDIAAESRRHWKDYGKLGGERAAAIERDYSAGSRLDRGITLATATARAHDGVGLANPSSSKYLAGRKKRHLSQARKAARAQQKRSVFYPIVIWHSNCPPPTFVVSAAKGNGKLSKSICAIDLCERTVEAIPGDVCGVVHYIDAARQGCGEQREKNRSERR